MILGGDGNDILHRRVGSDKLLAKGRQRRHDLEPGRRHRICSRAALTSTPTEVKGGTGASLPVIGKRHARALDRSIPRR